MKNSKNCPSAGGDDCVSKAIPRNWRARLPGPREYYARRSSGLIVGRDGQAIGFCPFCEAGERTLRLRLDSERGGWRCVKCDLKGDLVAFHQRLTGLAFKPAVRDLVGLPVKIGEHN